eukprot:CAMPEP_0178926672 /NCGR_PEP_ID=MMETSP0786-20121207/18684_1 /TAXON_ID=186022 /ORGANISM="Thalassionema frauenfeldii, Strain CCMP 1798" /LENGTH=214 /DNA_ID=CAMNT_0020601863 /DNA_START=24 /DNA_END=665 /DNA_ORIENTATION=+
MIETLSIHSEPLIHEPPTLNKSPFPRVQSEPTILKTGDSFRKKSVSFCRIEIREYDQILVDNPAVSLGLPLGLSWHYNSEHQVFDIDEYESKKPTCRSHAEMKIPRLERERKLREDCGVSRSEMMAMARKINIAKRQRRASITNTPAMEQTIQFFHSTKRIFKRGLLIEKNEDRKLRKAISRTMRRVKSLNDLNDGSAEANTNFNREFTAYFNV